MSKDLPQVTDTVVRLQHINEIRRARYGDQSPLSETGVETPYAGSLLDWDLVRARGYQRVNPDGTITDLTKPPLGPFQYSVGVISGAAVPGYEGTCGHLRFAPDRSFAYVATNTTVKIAGNTHRIGSALADEVPESQRIVPKPEQATPQSLLPYNDTGPIHGWGYDAAGDHSEMSTGVFVFATSEGDIQYGGSILGSFVGSGDDDLPGDAPEGTYAFLTSSGTWMRRTSSGWVDTGAVLLGAVNFEGGQPTQLYSERTQEYRDAIGRIPIARGLAGLTLAGFGGEDARSRYLQDYVSGSALLPWGIDNGEPAFWKAVSSSDRLTGGGEAIPDATGENNVTDGGSLDFLIWGAGIYGFHRFTPPVANPDQQGERMAPQTSIPVIPALGEETGVHAWRRARVIGTVCRMNPVWESYGLGVNRSSHSTPAFHFFPGYLGYYYTSFDRFGIRRFLNGMERNELLFPQPVFQSSTDSQGNANGAGGFPNQADDLQRVASRLATIKGE